MKVLKVATISVLTLLLFSGAALAGQAASNCGCGLGTLLWGNKADNSIASQSLQATTNGIFGNQTFGITSGTLGCSQPSKVAANERLIEFTAGNMDQLARDIARGEGESLATLAELLSVPDENRLAFNATLQGHFGEIFVDGREDAGTLLDRIVVATN